MVLHLRAPKGKESVEVMLNRAKYFDRTGKVNDHTIYLSGNLGKNALEFAMCLSAKATGGRVYTMGHTLGIEEADEAVLYFGADSTFRYAKEEVAAWEPRVQDVLAEKITEKLERAMAQEYGDLLAEHEKCPGICHVPVGKSNGRPCGIIPAGEREKCRTSDG